MSVTIYHNPRCSKSRQTLQLLQEHNIEPEVVEYLKQTPSAEELSVLLKKLGMNARELLRNKEDEYKALNLSDQTLSDEALIAAMVSHPKLIERPIVVNGDKAKIGRPPEQVMALFA